MMIRQSILKHSILACSLCFAGCAAPRMTFESSSDQPTPTVGLHFERPPEDKPAAEQQVAEADSASSTSTLGKMLNPFGGERKRIPLRRTDQAGETEQDSRSKPSAPATLASETAPFSF